MMLTKVRFPRGIEIDLNNVPEDFDAIIAKAFAEYTEGTAKAYTHHDKLSFIDDCRKYLHNATSINAESEVNALIKDCFAYELDENGNFMSEDDFLSIDFMEQCYNAGVEKGVCDLYSRYESNDHHVYEKIMHLLYRVIEVVIAWEG